MLRVATLLLCWLHVCVAGQWERAVLDHLFADGKYNPHERPVEDEVQPLQVTFGIILQQIIDVRWYSRSTQMSPPSTLRSNGAEAARAHENGLSTSICSEIVPSCRVSPTGQDLRVSSLSPPALQFFPQFCCRGSFGGQHNQ
ncbi:hypothetical protein RRG08_063998 [Elysia crispata]|uniref:Secreted protein n=1 Tax=Elysia crispata TaxID=231223 RepID=A0AAE1CY22_9GAST|nr:hypothetical protein RRG08_063998 [Elysia crispata]